MKPSKQCLKNGREEKGIKEYKGGNTLVQSTLYAFMELSE
jgi:hypothetical protein